MKTTLFIFMMHTVTLYSSDSLTFVSTNTIAYDSLTNTSKKFKTIGPLLRPRRHYAYYAEILDQIWYIKKIAKAVQDPFNSEFYRVFLKDKKKETISCEVILLLRSLNKNLAEFAHFEETNIKTKTIACAIQHTEINPLLSLYMKQSGTEKMTFLERHIFFKHFAQNLRW